MRRAFQEAVTRRDVPWEVPVSATGETTGAHDHPQGSEPSPAVGPVVGGAFRRLAPNPRLGDALEPVHIARIRRKPVSERCHHPRQRRTLDNDEPSTTTNLRQRRTFDNDEHSRSGTGDGSSTPLHSLPAGLAPSAPGHRADDDQRSGSGSGLVAQEAHPMKVPVRLAIANDYEVIVRGLAAMLEPYGDRIHIVELLVDEDVGQPVDVVLYDVFGSGEVHTGDIAQIVGQPHVGSVAVYTANFDQHLVDTALASGVSGYLSKGLTGKELADAVERLAEGETVVEYAPLRESDDEPRRWPGRTHDMTEREAEVLALITQGYENEVIAERLYISPNTLKSRIRNLYRKMGFENRVQAAVWGVKHGFEADHSRTVS